MRPVTRIAAAVLVLACVQRVAAEPRSLPTGAFTFDLSVTVGVTPEVAYDLFTGDVTGWWDHSVSQKPARMFIEAEVGGGFLELFDNDGNGVLHATVTAADRGRLLRFTGPMGLAGNALTMEHTVEFFGAVEESKPSTVVKVTVSGYGHMEESWPAAVEDVWHHFLVERYQRYVENGGKPLED